MRDTTLIGPWIRRFLLKHLVAERNLARNTRASYRDTMVLLLPFMSRSIRIVRHSSGVSFPKDHASGAIPDMAAAVVLSICSRQASSVDRSCGSRATFRSRYRTESIHSRWIFRSIGKTS